MSEIYEICAAQGGGEDKVLECVAANFENNYDEAINTFFLLFGGALIYIMQAGFAMLTAGSIRQKNVKNILLWNLLDSCGGGMGFFILGYAFAFGGDDFDGPKTFIGSSNFFLMGDVNLIFWFFNFAFCCTLSSIVAGTIAERCQMAAYLCYSFFLSGFVYPVVAHSVWSVNGFLSPFAKEPLWGVGAVDLAGSGPVHMCGGVAAFVAAIILGPRIGRFKDAEGNTLDEPRQFGPHSVALQFLGTFILWFGWYGFNPCSVLEVTKFSGTAALAAVNTTLAAAAGALSAMFLETFIEERKTGVTSYDLTMAMNGCLTGLAAVTSPCGTIEPWAGVVVGIVAGWVYCGASKLLLRFQIDDAVDAIPVHMVGGAWGILAAGLFSNASRMEALYGSSEHIGWFYEWGRGSGNFTLMGVQLMEILFIFGWCSVVMGSFFYLLKVLNLFRLDALEEEVGMDISRHKGAAYDITPASEKDVEALVDRRSSHGSKNSSRKLFVSKEDKKTDPQAEPEKEQDKEQTA